MPGREITLAHVIANPTEDLYLKLGLIDASGAIGIFTITPSEAAMIAADVATKSANVSIGFVDRFNGSLVITGDVAAVQSALTEVMNTLCGMMGFASAPIIILIGRSTAGKTTLCQRINHEELQYHKTQTVQIVNQSMIDTPGEYLERRYFRGALMVTAADADTIVLVQDATEKGSMFPPAYSSMFAKPCVGVVTKSDLASEHEISNARQYLKAAGAGEIFVVSSVTGEGVEALVRHLDFL